MSGALVTVRIRIRVGVRVRNGCVHDTAVGPVIMQA